MVRMLAPLLVLIAAAALVVATDRPGPRADFTFANHSEINTLDPQRMSWMYDLRVGRMLYEGLARTDLFGPEAAIRPAAAEGWEISEGGRTYTFHLRRDAKWSNGDAVRASDFVFTWRRALLPDTASDYSGVFQLIQGGKEFFAWRKQMLDEFKPGDDAAALWAQTERKFDEIVRLKAVDDRTLTFTLERPVPYFLDLCAFGAFAPVYPPLVASYERPDPETGRIVANSGWARPGVLVCNGPFALTGWRFKRDMDFRLNTEYWDRARVNFRTVRCVCIEDQEQGARVPVGARWTGCRTSRRPFRARHAGQASRLRASPRQGDRRDAVPRPGSDDDRAIAADRPKRSRPRVSRVRDVLLQLQLRPQAHGWARQSVRRCPGAPGLRLGHRQGPDRVAGAPGSENEHRPR